MAALISWTGHNFADGANITAAPGTSVSGDFPLINLKVRGLASGFRTLPATSAGVDVHNPYAIGAAYESGYGPGLVSDVVYAIAIQPDGKAIIGGAFSNVGGSSRSRLARLNSDGTLDAGFSPSFNNLVRAIAIQPDGKVVVGGDFTTVGGVARNRIARLNADGTLDTGFNPNAGGAVNAIAMQPDGKIIVGGAFTTIVGATRNRVARLTATGALDAGFNPGANGAVNVVSAQPDGKVVVGGDFTTIFGATRNRVARFSADGLLDTGFNPDANGAVNAVATLDNGETVIAGAFTTIGGIDRRRIAAITSNGTLNPVFKPDVTSTINTVAARPNGKLLIGGSFNGIDSLVAGRFAQLVVLQPRHVRVIGLLGITSTVGTITLSWSATGGDWAVLATYQIDSVIPRADFIPESLIVAIPAGIPASAFFRIAYNSPEAHAFGFARLWIGDALVLPDGIDAGWSMGFRDSGSLDPTDGQQWIQSPGVRTRVLSIPLDGARETETVWGFADGASSITNRMSLHALQMECGTTGEVIAVARTGTALWTRHSAVYGHIEQPWQIGHKAGPFWGGALTVVEER